MRIIFKHEDVKVTEKNCPIMGVSYTVQDEDTYFVTNTKPQLEYESLKQSLFEYQEMKDEDMIWEAKNNTENEF